MHTAVLGPSGPTRLAALALGLVLAACSRDEPAPSKAPAAATGSAAAAPAGSQHVTFIDAEPVGDDAALVVRREMDRARADGVDLVVYVGASWCEPCERFREAASAGKLDATLPRLRLVEFDLDRDKDRLERAGYTSKLVPLFVAPAADGTAGPLRMEGSVKGDGAVEQIVPRLVALVQRAKAAP
jgi:thiol-disulfide isomerase/thioredoxin